MNEQERLYSRSFERVANELDYINLIKAIQKLSAGLAAIISDDDKLIKQSRELYLNRTTISNVDEEWNKFYKFLDMKDRKDVLEQYE